VTQHAPSPMAPDELALTIACVVAGLVAMAFILAWLRGQKLRQAELDRAQAEADAALRADLVAQKLLTPDGKHACSVCQSARATDAWPVIERSWLDGVTFLKDLYALTPRYSVRDGYGDEYENRLCGPCKQVVKRKWQEVLAGKRTSVQRLFSEIEQELAQLQGGAMLAWARAENGRSREALFQALGAIQPNAPVVRQLVEAVQPGHERPISMPPMSTKESVAGDSGSGGTT